MKEILGAKHLLRSDPGTIVIGIMRHEGNLLPRNPQDLDAGTKLSTVFTWGLPNKPQQSCFPNTSPT